MNKAERTRHVEKVQVSGSRRIPPAAYLGRPGLPPYLDRLERPAMPWEPNGNDPLVAIHSPICRRRGLGYLFVDALVASCMLQTYPNWRLLLVDDYDGDFDLSDCIRRLDGMGIPVDPARVDVLRYGKLVHEKRNAALNRIGDAHLVTNFDDDDYHHANFIAEAVRALRDSGTSRGNFWSQHPVYDLRTMSYGRLPVGRCGSGHWVYRTSWVRDVGVHFRQHHRSGAASDEEFLRLAKAKDRGFSRLESYATLSGLALRFRHGRNVSYLGLPRQVADPDGKWLRRMVGETMYPLYEVIAWKLS